MISTFTAYFDANVFFGARLRSLVIELAQTGLFRARWSDEVHREWMTAVAKKRGIDLARLEATRHGMDAAVPDCLVKGYEPLIDSITLPDHGDRHVLAAAIVCKASVIVTFNLDDFPDTALSPYGLHAVHPDEFLLDVEGLSSEAVQGAVIRDIEHYRSAPKSWDEYFDDLRKAGVPKTAEQLSQLRILLGKPTAHQL
jgi:predicted nucleic acid-binding protein